MGNSIHGRGQLTVKKVDKANGDNFDRLEIDLDVVSTSQAIKLKTAETGKKPRTVTKRYSVLFLDKQDTNISVYQVAGCHNVFIEVESRTAKRVKKIVKKLRALLPYELDRVKNSLFEMYVKGIGKPQP